MNEQVTTWDARQQYTNHILEIINDMYSFKLENNVIAYKKAYKQLFILTYPYIKKYLKNNELDISEVDHLLKSIVPENTDHEIQQNQMTYLKIFDYLEEKEIYLIELLAKEKLLLPLTDKWEIGDAILQTR